MARRLTLLAALMAVPGVLASVPSPPSAPAAGFTIDTAGQVDGSRVFRMVDQVMARGGWRDTPALPDRWAVRRYEGTIREMADWWGLSDPERNYTRTAGGDFVFKPSPATKAALDEWAIKAGVRPCIVMATSTIPAPLIEGGLKLGQYGYNVRQPSDYARWYRYLRTIFRWLAAEYGRGRVRQWTYMLGIESDWQAKAVVPGTDREMNEADNRREYLKLTDWFHAACADELGQSVYVGVYWAFETQADDYLKHWATGTNFATGKRGTLIGYGGYSDWTVIGADPKNPFSLEGKHRRERAGNAFNSNAWAAGMVWKYDHIASVADRYPELRGLELGLPEAGYFDTRGATGPNGGDWPCDVVFADHRGATLRTMRTAAYAACPRIRWAWNRYALGTGDLSWTYADGAKPAQFHAIRIQQKLEGERVLPVRSVARPAVAGQDVRVIASATDRPGVTHRVVVVNYAEDFAATGSTRVRLRLRGLARRSVRVTEYRVDEKHNNWWPQWKAHREAAGMPYVAGRNQSHLGSGLLYKPIYAPWHADVIGTLRDEDMAKWLAFSARTSPVDGLHATGTREAVVAGGAAVLDYDIPLHGVIYLEVSSRPEPLVYAAPAGRMFRLSPVAGAAEWSRVIRGLTPGAPYTATCEARAGGRVVDYAMSLGKATAWGDRSALWNRLAATASADASGRLRLRLRVPRQPLEAADRVEFRELAVRRSGG